MPEGGEQSLVPPRSSAAAVMGTAYGSNIPMGIGGKE